MARSRNIKPGFFTNDVLAQCSVSARLLFIGLWTVADREGRLEDRPVRIKAVLFPFEKCDVEKCLDQLSEHGFIIRYAANGGRFIQIVNFNKHQCPHMKEPESSIPAPDSSGSGSVTVCHATYRGNPESGIRNQESERGRGFKPPTLDEVAAYCESRKNGIDPEQFIAHYESKGWRVGKAPMRNWHAAITTWEKNKGSFGGGAKRADDPRGNITALQKYVETLHDDGDQAEID
jgi:hypothetical protein